MFVAGQLLAQDNAAPPTSAMKEDQVTERALIDALAAPVPTRGIRVVGTESPAAPPASASLLITFATNSAQLTPQARKALDVVARAFSSDQLASRHFRIEGHADPRGNPESNLKLSRDRALAVRDYLNVKGIERDRLQPVGKGDREPAKPDEPAAPENRRVTFVAMNN
jgi:outer membrane protein OmpA-like peptidoglycan-associated protein